MKLMNIIAALIIFSFFSSAKAQYTAYPMVNVGYTYQNQHFGEIGGRVFLIKRDERAFRIGGSALLGLTKGKLAVVPKIQADALFSFFKENIDFYDVHQVFYYILGAEATTKSFAPYLGVSILGLLDFTGGYSFAYSGQDLYGKKLQGIKLGITLNIPLVKSNK